VVEPGYGAGLALESGKPFGAGVHLGGQHLERDVAPQAQVLCAIDLAHAARAERADDLVGAEARAVGQ